MFLNNNKQIIIDRLSFKKTTEKKVIRFCFSSSDQQPTKTEKNRSSKNLIDSSVCIDQAKNSIGIQWRIKWGKQHHFHFGCKQGKKTIELKIATKNRKFSLKKSIHHHHITSSSLLKYEKITIFIYYFHHHHQTERKKWWCKKKQKINGQTHRDSQMVNGVRRLGNFLLRFAYCLRLKIELKSICLFGSFEWC